MGLRVALFRRFAKPLVRFLVITGHAPPFKVGLAESGLGFCAALFRRLAIPLHRFRLITSNASAERIILPYRVLSLRIALVGLRQLLLKKSAVGVCPPCRGWGRWRAG